MPQFSHFVFKMDNLMPSLLMFDFISGSPRSGYGHDGGESDFSVTCFFSFEEISTGSGFVDASLGLIKVT